MKPQFRVIPAALALSLAALPASAEKGMFGGSPSRNMVSDETGLPAKWDVESGLNVKWSEPLGSQSYGGHHQPVLLSNSSLHMGSHNATSMI